MNGGTVVGGPRWPDRCPNVAGHGCPPPSGTFPLFLFSGKTCRTPRRTAGAAVPMSFLNSPLALQGFLHVLMSLRAGVTVTARFPDGT